MNLFQIRFMTKFQGDEERAYEYTQKTLEINPDAHQARDLLSILKKKFRQI